MSICASTTAVAAGEDDGTTRAGASAGSGSVSFGTYDGGSGAFTDLGKPALLNGALTGAHGAIVMTASVPAATNATLTITFGWNFPARDHFGKVFGNYYKNLFASSAEAAFGVVAPSARGGALAEVVADILAMQSPFHTSSLDPWLQDHLVNSLSHIRTAMWFDECTLLVFFRPKFALRKGIGTHDGAGFEAQSSRTRLSCAHLL
jgi:non-lysosomal glucosylceramidase